MATPLPEYDNPPVSETVLGVQFVPLRGYTSAHAGCFWQEYLDDDWKTAAEVVRLDDQFEKFGDEREWASAGISVRGYESGRVHIIRSDEEQLIQIQNSRFLYNWRKKNGNYPSYKTLLPEFTKRLEDFRAFVKRKELGEFVANQWEVTYVNHFERGELWNSPIDLPSLLPGLYLPGQDLPDLQFEQFNIGRWNLIIENNIGRLHVTTRHGKKLTDDQEIFILELTARGPIDAERNIDLWQGLDAGHEAIVRCFTAMTSDDAHKRWKRRV